MKAIKTVIALLVVSVMLLSACAPAAPAEPETIVVTKEVVVEKEVVVTQIVEVEKDPNAPVYGGTLIVTTPGIVHLDVNSVNHIRSQLGYPAGL